ncbi:hypothetical protein ACIP1U_14355 [Cupriavidus sp. NPDC089707]|uniref:hypothetical protein n=1 Tax=Cupriavidus sp. NPDC089707 TaxID=3363963 RepID=UPI003806964C
MMLPTFFTTQAASAQEVQAMPTLAQLIRQEKWDEANTYCRLQQNEAIPEIKAILANPDISDTTENFIYGCLRQFRTLESAQLLAKGLTEGGAYNSAYGLVENPRPEIYPILKAQQKPVSSAKGGEQARLLLTMAQILVPAEQRIADIQPYLGAKDYEVRTSAIFGLALLDQPGNMERLTHELGTDSRQGKWILLQVFYQFRAWRIPKFVPLLIPVLNDPQPLEDIGVRLYLPDGSEQSMTPEELRYCRARDYALNIIAKTLKLDLPFKLEEHVTYNEEQRELVKQKLRDLGYTVTNEPYPVTPES